MPAKQLCITEHGVGEKLCLHCSHLRRATFPTAVTAPAQYGVSIQALAIHLVEGQSLPYARASQLLHEVLVGHLSIGLRSQKSPPNGEVFWTFLFSSDA